MGDAFDPELAPIVELLPEGYLDDLDAARQLIAAMLETADGSADTSGVEVRQEEIPGPPGAPAVPVVLHVPQGAPPPGGRPALLDLHGGGFVLGGPWMQLGSACQVARQLGAVVAAPDYRLAPEHPFPAGVEDCYATLEWLAAEAGSLGVDAGRIAVGGQSAGGGLAAAVCLMARDRRGPAICFQLLGIPELDHRLETTSMRTFTDTPLWNRPNAELSWAYYLGEAAGEVSPYASPAVAEDLRGLPPALVTTMEFDPLRDEGIVYALRMMEAGVSVELHSYPGTFHGSRLVEAAAVSRQESADVLRALARALRATPGDGAPPSA